MNMMLAESSVHELRDLTNTVGGTIFSVAIIAGVCFIIWAIGRY